MKLRQLVIAALAASSAVTIAAANNTTLSQGNANVSQIQQALNDKGFNAGAVDGVAGPKTKAALKQFQQSQGISASGQLDGQTLAALGITAGASAGMSSTQGSTDTSLSSSPSTSQGAASIGSSQPPSSATPSASSSSMTSDEVTSSQQANGGTSGAAPQASGTSKY